VRAVGRRFLEPLTLVLLFAAGISAATGDAASAAIIIVIIVVSVGLDAVQEGRAAKAAEALKQSVALSAEVLREGKFQTVPATDIVPGEVFRVRTGDVIPADALVIEASSFTVNEAAMTGEPYPVEKRRASWRPSRPLMRPMPSSGALSPKPAKPRLSRSPPAATRCSVRLPRCWRKMLPHRRSSVICARSVSSSPAPPASSRLRCSP
jgi:magnesium-transporting ATPase (P-type)